MHRPVLALFAAAFILRSSMCNGCVDGDGPLVIRELRTAVTVGDGETRQWSVAVNLNATKSYVPVVVLYYGYSINSTEWSYIRFNLTYRSDNSTLAWANGSWSTNTTVPRLAIVAVFSNVSSRFEPPEVGSAPMTGDLLQSVKFVYSGSSVTSAANIAKPAFSLHVGACSTTPFVLSPSGSASSPALPTISHCRLGGKWQYVFADGVSSCPEVTVSEMAFAADGKFFVELFCDGCPLADLSGYQLVFAFAFNASTSNFSIPLIGLQTNDLGYAVVGSFAPACLNNSWLVSSLLIPSGFGVITVLGSSTGNGSFGGQIADSVVYSTSSLTAAPAWLGTVPESIRKKGLVVVSSRVVSENLSTSLCPIAKGFLTSRRTPCAPNSCSGVPMPADKSILKINEFNADIPGLETSGDSTEFIELKLVFADGQTAPSSLANYSVVLFDGSNSLAYRVFSLSGVNITASSKYVTLGTSKACNKSCDVYLPGNTIENGLDAIAVYYSANVIATGSLASTDGLVDVVVYSSRPLSSSDLSLLSLLNVSTASVLIEEENAFLYDESVGLCSGLFSLMPLTPGNDNNCATPISTSTRSSDFDVYINEWQPALSSDTSYVELVGRPNADLAGFFLSVVTVNTTAGVAIYEALPVALDGHVLTATGLLGLTGFSVATSSSGFVHRLILSKGTPAPAWSHFSFIYLPQDSVSVVEGSVANTGFVPISGGVGSLASANMSVSRCWVNASALASSAANGNSFAVHNVTRYAANYCQAPRRVLINEVCTAAASGASFVELLLNEPGSGIAVLDGYVLVLWNADNGTVCASVSINGSKMLSSAQEQFLVVDRAYPGAAAAVGALAQPGRWAVGLYYDYSFLYPVGMRVAAPTDRLQDAVVYGDSNSTSPLSTNVIGVVAALFPSSVYEQGVLTPIDQASLSLSRCNASSGAGGVSSFDWLSTASQGKANSPCMGRGSKVISMLSTLQQQLRVNEVNGTFVELLWPSTLAGYPAMALSFLAIVAYNTSFLPSAPKVVNAVIGLEGRVISPSGFCVISDNIGGILTAGAGVAGIALVTNAPLPTVGSSLQPLSIIDTVATYSNGSPPQWSPAFGDPPTLAAKAGNSLSRCFSNSSLTSAAFSGQSKPTPGLENDCGLPPTINIAQVCLSSGDRRLSVRLQSIAPLLPLHRLQLIVYCNVTFAPEANVNLTSNISTNVSGLLDVPLSYAVKNDCQALAVVLLYSRGVTSSSLASMQGSPSIPGLVDAMVLNFSPRDDVWQSLAAALTQPNSAVILVDVNESVNNTALCVSRCSNFNRSSGYSTRKSVPLQAGIELCSSSPSLDEVVINEVDIDQPGHDEYEFIELKGPPRLDAHDYSIIVLDLQLEQRLKIDLQGTFTKDGFFVIATDKFKDKRQMPFPNDVKGVLHNAGGAIVLHKVGDSAGGVHDALVYANNASIAASTAEIVTVVQTFMTSNSEVLIDDVGKYGGNESLSRCFCSDRKNSSCFALSWTPTPGGENSCALPSVFKTLSFCVNRSEADLAAISRALVTAINEACSCVFSVYQLNALRLCNDGLQFDVHGTSVEHLSAIVSAFNSVLTKTQLPLPQGGKTLLISSNCSLDCTAKPTPAAGGGKNDATIAVPIVVSVILIVAGVAIYIIRKRRRSPGFYTAHFDANFDDDDENNLVDSNATGRVAFSNPFRSASATPDRKRYAKL